VACLDRAARGTHAVGERVRDRLRTATRDGPADGVGEGQQDEAETCCPATVEWKHGVCCGACEQRARLLGTEALDVGRTKRGACKSRKRPWMTRQMNDRAQDLLDQLAPVGHERLDQPAVGVGVGAKTVCGCVERSAHHHS
jgi:hypothetical protein